MEEKYHQRLLEHTGKRIRFYRKLCNMSQDQLAAVIYTGSACCRHIQKRIHPFQI